MWASLRLQSPGGIAMDVRIDKTQLIKGLFLASGIADRKSTMPILANVLLRTDGKDRLLCVATDLNISVVASLSARVVSEGAITLGARQLHEIVKGLSGEEITLKRTDQNWAEIRSGRAEYKMVGMSERDFPKLPAFSEASLVKVDGAIIRDLITKTAFAVSTDDSRQHLAGVFFESDGARALMVSTDGHRLCKASRLLEGGPRLDGGILIPRKGVAEIKRALEGREAPCEMGVHQGQLILKVDDITIAVKLGDGQFPPFDQVIPKDNDKVVIARRDDLLDAFRRVSIMASDKTMGVRVALDKGKLSIEADNPDLGNARETLEVPYAGAPVTVGFNARYFIDILAEIATSEVRIELAGELDPAVVRPGDGSDYLGVVMPMRL